MDLLHAEITDLIIKAYYKVYNTLGYGFLEKVYENALAHELRLQGVWCDTQKPISVFYKGEPVGNYFADIVVDDCVILELKAAEQIAAEHEQQLLNYLRATNIEVGLVLNFGKKPEFSRKIFKNQFKSAKPA
jgi:GxxExxY protein